MSGSLQRIHIRDNHNAAEFAIAVQDSRLLPDNVLGERNRLSILWQLEHQLHQVLIPDAADHGLRRADKIIGEFLLQRDRKKSRGRIDDLFYRMPKGDADDPRERRVAELLAERQLMLNEKRIIVRLDITQHGM